MNSALLLMWILWETGTPSSQRQRRRRFWPPKSASPAMPSRVLPAPATIEKRETTDNSLRVRCFGGFEVERSGQLVADWRRNKARTVMKILIDRRHPVPREVMVDLLWPDVDARAAGNNLRVTLHSLRSALAVGPSDKAVEAECVLLEGGSLFINPRLTLWVDVDEFASRFLRGCKLERDGRDLDATAEFEHAEKLYRDDYLVEDAYEDWTQARREELKDQYLLIVTKLADHCLERRDFVGCILRCHKILQRDPCREDAYQRLMYAYALLGRPSQALHWYDVCVNTLRKELDLGPSEHTLRLHSQVLAREVDPPTAPEISTGTIFSVRSSLG